MTDPVNTPFEIEIAATGQRIAVGEQQTALAALHAAGFDIPMSCEQGVCGTCMTGVKGGVPDHRDHFLTDAERAANDAFMPCCSRSQTPVLVIDI
jgi:vanillate O-demethylase ferredoxin subunit